tara:strand:- start:151 stop:477 length:327 start_codon:yes stop_codon:yes gene_type:complete
MELLSIIESIYIVYMFNYYETKVFFNHPMDILTSGNYFFNHQNKKNHICILGNLVGILLAIWFLLRHFFDYKKYNKWIINIVMLGCLLTNTNAVIYFIPIFIIENSVE